MTGDLKRLETAGTANPAAPLAAISATPALRSACGTIVGSGLVMGSTDLRARRRVGAAAGAPADAAPDGRKLRVGMPPARRDDRPAPGQAPGPERFTGARRRVSPNFWSSLASTLARQHEILSSDLPRVRPTLPNLNFMAPHADAGGAP